MGATAPPPVAAAPAVAPVAPVAQAAPVAEATVERMPPKLQEAGRPVVISGTVTGRTPDGLTQVRTAAGEILLKSTAPVPADRPVTLQITPAALLAAPHGTAGQLAPGQTLPGQTPGASPLAAQLAPARALVFLLQLTPAGSPPQAGAPAPGAGSTPGVVLPRAPAPAPSALPPLLPGAVVPALVIAASPRSGPPAGALPGSPAPAPSGAAAGPPARSGTAGTPSRPGAAAPAMAGSATFGVPVELGGDSAHPGADRPGRGNAAVAPQAGASPDAPDLPQGATVALRILTVTPAPARPAGMPGQGTDSQGTAGPEAPPVDHGEPPADTPDGPVLRGTVAGATPQGQPVLATRQGMLVLNVQASLPQGARVTAALADPAQAAAHAPAAGTPAALPGPLNERNWPAMQQIVATLAGLDRGAAQSLLSTLPQPNRKLTAALTFFLSAMRGGDARGWLGEEAASALERSGRGELLAQLDRDFQAARQQAGEPLPGDWTPFTLPMFDTGGLNPVRLHLHPIQEEETGEGKGRKEAKGSRFLLDLELSRLGPLQLDGLVRPNHFDLILRSGTPLAPEFRLELIQIFADSLRALGYSGGLSFQSGARCWVKLTRAGRPGPAVTA